MSVLNVLDKYVDAIFVSNIYSNAYDLFEDADEGIIKYAIQRIFTSEDQEVTIPTQEQFNNKTITTHIIKDTLYAFEYILKRTKSPSLKIEKSFRYFRDEEQSNKFTITYKLI